MSYYQQIKGVDVWVTVERPYVPDDNSGGYKEAPGCCAIFKFGDEPGLIKGEMLRDADRKPRWFDDPGKAATEGFAEAAKRIG
jgi:hypothetical protein